MAETKQTYLVTNDYTSIGDQNLAPGDRVLVDEDNTAHKFLKAQAEAGNPEYGHLSVVEVDHKAEAKQQDELAEQLKKAEKIAAEQRAEEAQEAAQAIQEQQDAQAEALENGQPAATEGTDFPPQDEEAIKLAEQSGAGQRATTQEDVVEETKATGRKRSSRG